MTKFGEFEEHSLVNAGKSRVMCEQPTGHLY